jgi:hypothetical protein
VGPTVWLEEDRPGFRGIMVSPAELLRSRGVASSLAGLHRVGVSTKWCGWADDETVNRKSPEKSG